jgi:hypothetical protein
MSKSKDSAKISEFVVEDSMEYEMVPDSEDVEDENSMDGVVIIINN